MPAQLVALSEGPNILLDKPIMLFGRNTECDIQIESRKISRRHCCIAQVNDYLVVRDLGSTNGIRINGVRVLEGRLKGGDELTIGSHRYQVRWDALETMAGRMPAMAAPPPRAKAPVPPPPSVADDDDELLEECDEPVPLPEPGGMPAASPRPAAVPPIAATHVAADSSPMILPENLELSPGSDVHGTGHNQAD